MRKSEVFMLTALCLSVASPAFADATVTIKNFDYSPMMLTVKAGDTVTWKNLDGEPHTVVSTDGLFRSKALDENDSFAFKFDKPGTYKYVCSIHPKMVATVTVQ
ncbi:MAG TPA: cupredoxin family copper-binding protein [Rhizomicrobium sp.]|jgi:plastocyanin